VRGGVHGTRQTLISKRFTFFIRRPGRHNRRRLGGVSKFNVVRKKPTINSSLRDCEKGEGVKAEETIRKIKA